MGKGRWEGAAGRVPLVLPRSWHIVGFWERSGGCCADGSTLAASWSPWLLFSPQAVPAVTPVDEESSDGEPDQEAVQR